MSLINIHSRGKFDMKTIKQIADELQLDKQKVYRYIKRNHITEAHQDGQVKWYDEAAENRIKSARMMLPCMI